MGDGIIRNLSYVAMNLLHDVIHDAIREYTAREVTSDQSRNAIYLLRRAKIHYTRGQKTKAIDCYMRAAAATSGFLPTDDPERQIELLDEDQLRYGYRDIREHIREVEQQ